MRKAELIHIIEIHQTLSRLVAEGHIKSAVIDGEVVYWHDEDCTEAYEALDPYCA